MSCIEFCGDHIKGVFSKTPNFDMDLDSIFDTHFTSIDTSEVGKGNEVFSLTRKLARFLLHNLGHDEPTDREIKRILRLKAKYDFEGVKNSWPGSPVVINNSTRCIEDGVTRLYAIALGKQYGHYMPMRLDEGSK